MRSPSFRSGLLAAMLAATASLFVAASAVDARDWGDWSHDDDDWGRHDSRGVRKDNKGVVSVSHPLAAEVGARMLEKGGNAIDAAAAISFALNVVEPNFSGIGGGGFMMLYWAKTGETFIVDSRERAPAAATPNMFLFSGVPSNQLFAIASTSGIAVGVPGTLAGIDYSLKRWGKKKLAETLEPAIELAKKGFHINSFLAGSINCGPGGRNALQPETAAIFCPGGVALAEGDLLEQPDLAKTLKLIARHGKKVFSKGEIAEAIVEAQKRSRSPVPADGAGRMTLEDLATYEIKVREPLVGNYRGWTLASMPPPSSGALTILQMLQMVEGFPLGDAGMSGWGFGGSNTLHVMIEAMRLAFADRAVWMGDEDFVYVPKSGLLNPAYVATRSGMINLGSRMSTPSAGNPLPYDVAALNTNVQLALAPLEPARDSHTTHFSVVDKFGNVVSYTTTIEAGWGTGITVPGYGFLLNNELTDFNFEPMANPATGNPGANDVAPFKRPRSSMSPSILFKGDKPFAAYGSPGGATIINSVFNITLNLIDHGMTLQEAIDAPRLSVTSATGTVSCEGTADFITPRFSIATQDALRTLGHLGLGGMGAIGTDSCLSSIGSVQIVAIDLQTGLQYGAADPRREGTVIDLPEPKGKGKGKKDW